MNWETVRFDWNQARAFLATAEEGSLSAAARALDLTQPTLGRQVAALEAELGITLFERVGRSLSLTNSGIELLEHFRAMGDAAARITLAASGQSQAIDGQVRITTTDMVATHILPPMLRRVRDAAPGIDLEIIASNEVRDLHRREADIAIRHVRPEQPDLIARLIGETTARFYAATAYLERHGRPQSAADLEEALFVGGEQPERYVPGLNALGLALDPAQFKITTTSGPAMIELMRQGYGISPLPKAIAAREPLLECVLPELPPIPVPVWLVTHRELHTSRRIRLVYDELAEALAAFLGSEAATDPGAGRP
ncbi:MAG: LysR family transcriptional regulator [Myxococcota bacterium]